MNGLPLHPAVVHIPLGLAVILPLVALGITLAVWRGWVTPKTWAIVVLLQALVVGAGFVALQSGESEEERVEPVVAEQYIESHEEAAHRFMIGAGISLALGVAGLVVLRRKAALKWTTAGATVATVIAAFLAVSVGGQGGELVYRHGAASAYQAGTSQPTATASDLPAGAAHSDDD